MEAIYNVNGNGFNLFSDAVRFASANGAVVIQNDNGLQRWAPIAKKNIKRIKHVIVNADGSEAEFSKVSR